MKILNFIKSLRKTDIYIEHIFLFGGCYRFHLFLKDVYPECEPFINYEMNHIVSFYKGKYYDIRGIVKGDAFFPLSDLHPEQIEEIKKWSFHKHQLIKITECPYCEEPLTYKYKK